MADLSADMQFGCVMSGGSSPTLTLLDTGAYPGGVPALIQGYFTITYPSGITVQIGSFSAPVIFWNGSALTQSNSVLSLANNQSFMNGAYSITYYLQAAGYTASPLTKTFVLNYTRPTAVIVPNFDNFTPNLSVTDATVYGQSTMNFISATDNWSVVINNVGGVSQTIVGSGITFTLAYLGSFYDSSYQVTLTAVPTWQLAGTQNWVTIIDQIAPAPETFTTEIPPTLTALLTQLTSLKSQLDGAQTNGNIYGNSIYGNLLTTYTYAGTLYQHLVARGQSNSLSGLSAYVYQLQMLFNNGQMPVYVNTGTAIPAYNWGSGGGGSTTWGNVTGKPFTQGVGPWTVGQGGYPGTGVTVITNALFDGANIAQILIFRNNGIYLSFTKSSQASNQITLATALGTGETMYILIIAL
jgi:hypothetical protein